MHLLSCNRCKCNPQDITAYMHAYLSIGGLGPHHLDGQPHFSRMEGILSLNELRERAPANDLDVLVPSSSSSAVST